MSTTFLTQELQGKPIISVTNGQIIAKVVDVLIDPDSRRVAAAVTGKGGLLKRQREIEVIHGDEVQVWGQDAVLVKRPDAVIKDSELPGSGKWLSVASQLKGHDVIGTDGTRIGQLNDLVIDVSGQFVGYNLTEAFTFGEDPSQTIKQIPAEAMSVFGRDVLIVDMTRIERATQIEESTPIEETTESTESTESEEPSEFEGLKSVELWPGSEEVTLAEE